MELDSATTMETSPPHGPDWDHVPPFGRRQSIVHALKRLSELHAGPVTIVETGTLRNDSPSGCSGDGWSTVAWGWFAAQVRGRVCTVDVDANALATCREVTRLYRDVIAYVCSDSVAFLRRWSNVSDHEGPSPTRIHLLYLDSLDYHDHDRSEAHSLAEAQAALPALAPTCLVLFDDTATIECDPDRRYRGKGARAVPFLLDHGFTVDHECDGQVLLVRESHIGPVEYR